MDAVRHQAGFLALLSAVDKTDVLHLQRLCDNGIEHSNRRRSVAGLLPPMPAPGGLLEQDGLPRCQVPRHRHHLLRTRCVGEFSSPSDPSLSRKNKKPLTRPQNILTDFIILFLPIRPLWALQASLTRRLGVIAVVSVGGVAVVVSCLRIIVLHQFAINPDFTYILGQMVIISAVELNVAIMAANAPSFKAIWLKHVSGSLSEYVSSVQLSSLNKRKQSGAPEPSVVYQRSVPKRERDILDSSSTNNLVGSSESRESVN